jgi:hypothetical protein
MVHHVPSYLVVNHTLVAASLVKPEAARISQHRWFPHLEKSGKKAESGNGNGTATGNVDDASVIAVVVARGCGLRGTGTAGLGSLSGSAGRGTRGGCALLLILSFPDLLNSGRGVLQAMRADVTLASSLDVEVATAVGDAIICKSLADEEGDRLGVKLKTGSRAVGRAGTFVLESFHNAIVVCRVQGAENIAGVVLGRAPGSS